MELVLCLCAFVVGCVLTWVGGVWLAMSWLGWGDPETWERDRRRAPPGSARNVGDDPIQRFADHRPGGARPCHVRLSGVHSSEEIGRRSGSQLRRVDFETVVP